MYYCLLFVYIINTDADIFLSLDDLLWCCGCLCKARLTQSPTVRRVLMT